MTVQACRMYAEPAEVFVYQTADLASCVLVLSTRLSSAGDDDEFFTECYFFGDKFFKVFKKRDVNLLGDYKRATDGDNDCFWCMHGTYYTTIGLFHAGFARFYNLTYRYN